METPLLILFFNRKDTVLTLMRQLSKIKPSVLYLSSDGGRSAVEQLSVEAIRQDVLEAVKWDCEIHTKFNDENFGCKKGVHSAIQWFFRNVPEGIILEDDCIPSPPFFDYMSKMLQLYRDEKTIATIGGRNELPEFNSRKNIYSSKFFCWGWASWADRVKDIDVEFGYQPNLPQTLYEGVSFYESQHLKGMRQLMTMKVVNSWAYSYDFAFRAKKQLHVLPPLNYINNIGINIGTHSDAKGHGDSCLASDEFVSSVSVIDTPIKNKAYINKYLLAKYGLLKLFLFPWIGQIKTVARFFR